MMEAGLTEVELMFAVTHVHFETLLLGFEDTSLADLAGRYGFQLVDGALDATLHHLPYPRLLYAALGLSPYPK